jgi:hypothetical protein
VVFNQRFDKKEIKILKNVEMIYKSIILVGPPGFGPGTSAL